MIDTVIVGAGPAGLCAAKTILQCDPNAEVKIYDAHSTIGGVWSKDKIYPLLKTNHFFGGLDFSDFPMQEGNGAKRGDHIPGTAVHDHLRAYARRWHLNEKIQLNTKVLEVSKCSDDQGWELKIEHDGNHEIRQCRKLIIAIGVNNAPSMPEHKGSADFNAPILHSSELGKKADGLFQDDSIKTVAVLGGAKSAYDAVHLAATSGRQVEWIIRKSGKGPAWIFPLVTQMGPVEAQRDNLSMMRVVTFFSPCIWNDGFAWIRRWIQGTTIGRFIAQKFWAQLHIDTLRDCAYRSHEKLKVLEPPASPFWYGTLAGAATYGPVLYDYIKNGQVRIHRQDIASLSHKTICLGNGEYVTADALISATGFSAKPLIKFNPPSLHSDLGIPTTNLSATQQEFWRKLDTKSDEIIYQNHPELLNGPLQDPKTETPQPYNPGYAAESSCSPYRLYRSIAPPGLTAAGDRSLAFVGVFGNISTIARMELQCLWAYAYLNNKIDIDEKKAYEEASMLNRFCRHRSPFGHGRYYPDHVFDQLPYIDTLVQDLGLSPWRKSNILSEIFTPYKVDDYRGIVLEWVQKNQKV